VVRNTKETKPQFYWIVDSSENGIGYETLFHQSGIARSEIQMELPEGFYIVYDNYIITIRFEATPILTDFNNLNVLIPNNAPLVKIAATALIKQRREKEEDEERQRQMDDD
jgi:hypothetical protein